MLDLWKVAPRSCPCRAALRGRQRWLPMAGVFREALGPLREDVPCCDQWEHPFFGGSLSTENSNMIMIYYDYCSNSKHVFRLNSCGMKNVWALGWVQLGEHRERDSEHVWVLLDDLIWTSYIDVDGWKNELIFDEIFAGPHKLCISTLDFHFLWNFRVSGSTEKITIDDWMPSKLDEHVKLRLHYAVSTGFLLKDWPYRLATGRTRVLLYRLGSPKRDWWWLVMKSKLVSISFGGLKVHLHDLLLDFVRKLPKF